MALSSFKLMCSTNKGMIIVLLWALSGWIMFHYGTRHILNTDEVNRLSGRVEVYLIDVLGGISAVLVFPVIGWIADIRWGRYKTIRWCLFTMWLTTIAMCLVSLLAKTIQTPLLIPLYAILFFSLGGLQINIIQFGVDQIPDASSTDLIAFSNWYVWVRCIGYIIAVFSVNCVSEKYTVVAELLLPVCTTLALCLDYNFNHWLIKEPTSENPLKLIYRVMHYAWKNKYPRQRSAFTYSDDKRYSRIDFAKQKFGGPYTTEKVEDVKTFWRVLLIYILGSLFFGFIYGSLSAEKFMRHHLRNFSSNLSSFKNCFQEEAVYNSGYFLIIAVVPLSELALQRFIGRLSLFAKFNIGVLLVFISTVVYLSLEVAGHIKLGINGTNIKCMLENKDNDLLPLDFKWSILPECLHITADFLLLSTGVQFICAQSPYSMKGLLFGFGYGVYGFLLFMSDILLLSIIDIVKKSPPSRYGCGMWYLLSLSVVQLLVCILACVVSRSYKKRQRGDTLPNEHIFAINYYSRYTMSNSASVIS